MLAAAELRVGNKFKSCFGNVQTVLSIIDNTDGGKIKVCADCPDNVPHYKSEKHRLMYSHLILCEENGNQYKPCEIEGEPLTEEWLISFGFIKEKNKNIAWDYTDIKTGWFTISERDGFYKFCNIRDLIGKQFHYVHQLQNLYFCLTGNDLSYNK
jgi:hypothetical protein